MQPCIAEVKCEVRVRNVVFRNIDAEAENGCLLWGAEGTAITGVEFQGVHFHMLAPKPDLAKSIGGNLDLRWTALSPRDGIVKSDIPAFYARQSRGCGCAMWQVDWAKRRCPATSLTACG